jgi:hypothetical protein
MNLEKKWLAIVMLCLVVLGLLPLKSAYRNMTFYEITQRLDTGDARHRVEPCQVTWMSGRQFSNADYHYFSVAGTSSGSIQLLGGKEIFQKAGEGVRNSMPT